MVDAILCLIVNLLGTIQNIVFKIPDKYISSTINSTSVGHSYCSTTIHPISDSCFYLNAIETIEHCEFLKL